MKNYNYVCEMKTVFLSEGRITFDEIYGSHRSNEDNVRIISQAATEVDELVEIIDEEHSGDLLYLSENPEQAWKEFTDYFVLIEAAGGVVKNDEGGYLVIFRKGKWDLPKGKVEYDENPDDAAIREVMEECGIISPEIIKEIETTFHVYHEKNKRILKKTHWYLMAVEGPQILHPEAGEDITDAQWMTEKEISEKVIPVTYPLIKQVMSKVISSAS
jgi:8-oxo-dGTP pyrophosphatase MutT (NUDIX family)